MFYALKNGSFKSCLQNLARRLDSAEQFPRIQCNYSFTPCFDFFQEDRVRGKVDAILLVEMKHVRRGFAWVSPESHLDALLVDTGISRICSRNFPAKKTFRVQWHSWSQWHPEAEPGFRAAFDIFGVPWNLSIQLGVIDSLLFSPIEPSLKHRVPIKLPPQEEVKKHILGRAMTFGLKNASVTKRADGFQLHLPQQSIMPDPFTATNEVLEPFLGSLLAENPGEDDACLQLARWKFALQQRQSYLPLLARPGCGNDLPFYSVVEPVKQLHRFIHFFDDAPDVPIPYCSAHPPVEDFQLKLQEASRPAESVSFDVQEFARIELLKSVKMSLAMPVRLWCAKMDKNADPAESSSAALDFDSVCWVEMQPWALTRGSKAERDGKRRWWPCDVFAPDVPIPYCSAHPPVEDFQLKLQEASRPAESVSFDVQEFARIELLKSVKMSLAMPVRLWCAKMDKNADPAESSSAALDFDSVCWVEMQPWALTRGSKAERDGKRRWWPCDVFAGVPSTYDLAQPGPKQIIVELRKISETCSFDGSLEEREALRIAIVKKVKKSFESLAEGELVLWSLSCEALDRSEGTVRWVEVDPSALREQFHCIDSRAADPTVSEFDVAANKNQIPWTHDFTDEAWKVLPGGVIAADPGISNEDKSEECFEIPWSNDFTAWKVLPDGVIAADPGISNEDKSEECFEIPWSNDFTAWKVLPDGVIAADPGISHEDKSEECFKIPWNNDFTDDAWDVLPDGVIAADSEVHDPGRFWEWTDELRRKHKLPVTWSNVQLVPEDYTPEVALRELKERLEEARAQREKSYEELARCGELLVQWPSQGVFPKADKTARFQKVIAMLHLRHNERKKSMCNREFQPTKRTYVAPNHRCQGPGSYSCSWSSFGPQVLSTCATAPAFSFGSASRFRDRDWWIGGWTYACPSSFGHQVLSTHATAPAFSIPRAALQFNWNEIFKALATAPRGAEKHQPDSSSVKQQQAMRHGFTFCGQADMVATAPVEEVVSRFRRQETIRREVAILYAKRFLGEWELYSGLLQHQFTVLKIRALRTRQQEQDLQQDYCDKLTKRGELTVFRFWQASDQFPRQEMTEKEKYYQERVISKLNIMRQNFLQKSSERRMLRLNFPEKIRYDVVEPHYGNLPYDIGKSILSGASCPQHVCHRPCL